MSALRHTLDESYKDSKKRFYRYVVFDGPVFNEELGACHIWCGRRNNYGRGQFRFHGKMRVAHQVAWELKHKKHFPVGKEGGHLCNNLSCVNPDHTIPCTHKENSAYMFKCGRANRAFGDKHYKSKLRSGDLWKIRALRRLGWTQREVAKVFNVSDVAISCVEKRKTWKQAIKK